MSLNIKAALAKLITAVTICAVASGLFPGASIAQDEVSSLQLIIDKLVTSYNKKDAVAYRENFSKKLKGKFTLEKTENILDVGVDEQDSIISHSTDISADGSRALVFVETESAKLDLHMRINKDNEIERLNWYTHKADPSGVVMSAPEKLEIQKRYQSYADKLV